MTVAERRRRRIAQPGFWGRQASNTLDRATAMMPRLLYSRLDEFGCDYAIIYPPRGCACRGSAMTPRAARSSARTTSSRGLLPHSERPDDAGGDHPDAHAGRAIEELEFVTRQLGSKVGMFGAGCRAPCRRPRSPIRTGSVSGVVRRARARQRLRLRPVWKKCEELGIAPTFHSAGSNQGLRKLAHELRLQPTSSFRRRRSRDVQGDLPRGVTRRFPKLRFAFLEGGVGWRASSSATSWSTGSAAIARRWRRWTRGRSIARC